MCQLMTTCFLIFIVFPLRFVVNGLSDDDAGLNEVGPDVAVIITSEVCKSSGIAWRRGDDKAFFCPFCQVAQDYVLCMPSQSPSAAFQHSVAHFVNFGVI